MFILIFVIISNIYVVFFIWAIIILMLFVNIHVIFFIWAILFKISRNSVLLINNPSKRGDVEIVARSSVSPPPQVKTKLKLTASR